MRAGLRTVLLLGLLSLFGDFVYEGGRAVAPDLFRQLGLTAAGVGLVMGAAELAGWAARPIGGAVADRSGRYDLLVRIGYGMLFVVPLMAFAQSWAALAAIVFVERVARGLRVPARDAMLARLRGEMGLGSAFGLHEFLDQFGAMAGPLMIAAAAAAHGEIRTAVLYTLLPYAALLLLVWRVPKVSARVERDPPVRGPQRRVIAYTAAASLNVAGLLPISIVLYKVSVVAEGAEWMVPLAYSVAMVTDAVAAIPLGRALDRYGARVVSLTVLVSAVPAALLTNDLNLLLVCAGLVGVVIGAQESIFRAVVAELAGSGRLGTAYGVFGLGVGIGYSVAGLAFGLMVDAGVGPAGLVAYSLAAQLLSLWFLRVAVSPERKGG
ncbi:MAG: MFS transporter [Thaumarchaeota archaeon]|nr:MFS transporter [Candidatus Calditenuaceae archaeon]MDW8043003.1 MFS transporter [Nitrososphaerota archaeon]